MCARGYAVKTDDRGKSRKLVCSDVLEETYREGDRRVCRTEMGEQLGWPGRASGERRGRSQGMVRWAAGEDGSRLLIISASC